MSVLFDNAASEYLEYSGAIVSAYPFTLACWFYSDDATIDQELMAVGNPATNSNYWSLRAAGAVGGDPVQVIVESISDNETSTSTGFSANTWHHACGVFTSSTSRTAYIDGGSSATGTTDLTPTSPNLSRIGFSVRLSPIDPRYMSGRIAEAAIWDVALSAAEVVSLAKGFAPLFIRPASLVAYWPLDRNSFNKGGGSTTLDRWKGTYNLTETNTPALAEHPRIYYPHQVP